MSSRLRDAIVEVILARKVGHGRFDAEPIADSILAIPEIANGQALLTAKMDELGGGTGFVRIERIDPADVYVKPDDASIAVHPKD